MRMCNGISRDEISLEWDEICERRQSVIEQEKDVSLIRVTGPCMLRHVKEEAPERLLDVGCGTGYLTDKAAESVAECLGIDVSSKSIEIARKKYETQHLHFETCAISALDKENYFDACMANMVFMTDPEWELSVKRIYDMLNQGGVLFITITHPCFWPKYWGYDKEEWFHYNKEIFIKHDFSTSMVKSIGQTTHIHRPLEKYFQTLCAIGFQVEKIEEPYPTGTVPEEYRYEYPRFLFIQCRKRTL